MSLLPERKFVKTNSSLFNYVRKRWLGFFTVLSSSWSFDSVVYLCDIESLYTSIPVHLSIETIDYSVTRKQNLIPEQFKKNSSLNPVVYFKE